MKWSENQLKAIYHCDHPIIVAASAGAGKTAVLTQRIIKRCLVDHIDIDRIVALTFTKAAAEEMKQRIHQALMDALDDPNSDHDRIQAQLVLLADAKISTIHSFCLDIIKKYGYVLGFDPGRIDHMLDGIEMAQIKEDAFDRTIELLDKMDYQRLMDVYSLKPLDHRSLKQMVETIYDQAVNTNDPFQWLDQLKVSYPLIGSIDDLDEQWIKSYFQLIQINLNRLKPLIDTLIHTADQAYLDKNETILEVIDDAFKDIQVMIDTNNIDGYDTIHTQKLYYGATLSNSKKIPKTTQDLIDHIKDLFKSWVNDYDIDTLIKADQMIYPLVEPLIHMVTIYIQQIEQLKKDHNGIDFNDMEYLAYTILHTHPEISAAYKALYQEICVDEFQDTSLRQHAIIEMVSNGSNIFRVGDVKQSIYGFRQASPSLMRTLMDDPNQEVIGLTEKYRSGETIIEFTNVLFEQLMNIDPSLDRYSSTDIVSAGSTIQKQNHQPIEFHVINESGQCDLDHQGNDNTKKAWFMAKLILEMMHNSHYTHFSDYCILVRSRVAMGFLQRALDTLNIPYAMNLKSGLNNSDAIKTFKAFIDATMDHHDEIALACVLTSPLYGMDINDLITLSDHGSLYQGLNDKNHPLFHDLTTAYDHYHTQGLHGIITYYLSTLGVYRSLDDQGKANMDAILERIASNPQWTSLDQLSNGLDDTFDHDSSEVEMIEPNEDVVKIMTMHQSKGLQFPVVIVWSDHKNTNQETDRIITDTTMGIGIKARLMPHPLWYRSLPYLMIQHHHEMDELSERIRLLYVALTRAKEKLIIVDRLDSIPDANGYTMENLLSRKGFSDCLLSPKLPQELFEVHQFNQTYSLKPLNKPTKMVKTIPPYDLNHQHPIETTSATQYMATITLDDHDAALAYGTTLHQTLEILELDQLNDADLTTYDPSLTVAQRNALSSYGTTMKQFIKDHGIDQIQKEYPFIQLINHRYISGSIDWIGQGRDGIHIVDYKTTNATANELIERYKNQLITYKSIIASTEAGQVIHCWIYSFHLNQFIAIE